MQTNPINVGCIRMPPNEEAEWWELQDEAREMPYYYHTKSGETQWTRPEGFVIPLGIIQVRPFLERWEMRSDGSNRLPQL